MQMSIILHTVDYGKLRYSHHLVYKANAPLFAYLTLYLQHSRVDLMVEGAAEEATQSSHSDIQPRERTDGALCHHWQSGRTLQSTQSITFTLTLLSDL